MREAPQISRKRLAAESQTSADLDSQDWWEIVDFTRLEALGAKDVVCKHCFPRWSRLLESVCCAIGNRSRRPKCAPEERKVFQGGSL